MGDDGEGDADGSAAEKVTVVEKICVTWNAAAGSRRPDRGVAQTQEPSVRHKTTGNTGTGEDGEGGAGGSAAKKVRRLKILCDLGCRQPQEPAH